jgi:hypothetical protein
MMSVDSNHILEDLTRRQFLRPHSAMADVLSAASAALGFCPRAATHAMRWLEINPDLSIGRLRRTELTQLARSIYRFWKHAIATETHRSAK